MTFYDSDHYEVEQIAQCMLGGAKVGQTDILLARMCCYMRGIQESADISSSPDLTTLHTQMQALSSSVLSLMSAVSTLEASLRDLTPENRRLVFRAGRSES